MTTLRLGVVVGPGEGRQIQFRGNQITRKVGPDTGAELLSMFVSELGVGGGGIFPHVHRSYEEAFYVLGGEVTFLLGSTTQTAGPGSAVFIPSGAVHGFANESQQSARLLVIHSPARAIEMVESLARLESGDRESVERILSEHDSAVRMS